MDTPILISLFFVILLAKAQANIASCSPINCATDSNLNIQFPFKLQNFQPHHCGVPGFELHCKQNKTVLHFPSYGDLVIKSISYDLKKLQLLDPKNCVHEVFLNLNLSYTPFSSYYTLKEYQYINCSAKLSSSFLQVPCLGGFGHHVYVVETSFVMPRFCDHVKTVGIPFSYSPFLYDNTFGLVLTWDLANFQDNETAESTASVKEEAGHHKKVLFCIIFIFILVMLFNTKKASHFKKLDVKEFHGDLHLGDYEALKPKRESITSVKVSVDIV